MPSASLHVLPIHSDLLSALPICPLPMCILIRKCQTLNVLILSCSMDSSLAPIRGRGIVRRWRDIALFLQFLGFDIFSVQFGHRWIHALARSCVYNISHCGIAGTWMRRGIEIGKEEIWWNTWCLKWSSWDYGICPYLPYSETKKISAT